MKKVNLKTPITYYGGKQTMLKHILPLVPEHVVYTEVFAGGAALFFAKERSKVEVINDLNGEIINFYETIVGDFDALKKMVEKTLHSRAQFEHAWYIYNTPGYFSKVERAWAILTLSKLGFAGKLSSSFGFDKKQCSMPKRIFYTKEALNLSLKERLETVTIENDDALKILNRFDVADAFHFIDPPYVGSNMGHYSNMFNNENLLNLLNLCVKLKGKFMLTMYPNELIKSFAEENGWIIHEVERNITAGISDVRRKQTEWIIVNYSLNIC